MTTDYRALCAELLSRLEESDDYLLGEEGTVALADRARVALAQPEFKAVGPTVMEIIELADEIEAAGLGQVVFAHAVLARWGRPAPAPADGEVAELVEFLRIYGDEVMDEYGDVGEHDQLTRAADLLEHQAAPVPVPVAERLPGDQLCWWYEPDEDDDPSGYGGCWTLLRIRGAVSYYTHWLPATALPLPQGEVRP